MRAKNEFQLPDIYALAFDNYIEFHDTPRVFYTDPDFVNQVQKIIARPHKKNISSKNITTRFSMLIDKKEYSHALDRIKHYIVKGEVYQINYTYRLHATTTVNARRLFLKIIKKNPVDFLGFIEGPDFELLLASPECFVTIHNNRINTFPIKGTRPRGKNTIHDVSLKRELLESNKEQAELDMITDLLRNDIGKFSRFGSVKVIDRRLIIPFKNVWHTYAHIQGELRRDIHPIDALLSMLPGGSVTGCPKKRAIEIIDELEHVARGVYTGALFTIDTDQKLTASIVIRTIIKKGNDLYLPVGSGIVYDSVSSRELSETLDKAQSFMRL